MPASQPARRVRYGLGPFPVSGSAEPSWPMAGTVARLEVRRDAETGTSGASNMTFRRFRPKSYQRAGAPRPWVYTFDPPSPANYPVPFVARVKLQVRGRPAHLADTDHGGLSVLKSPGPSGAFCCAGVRPKPQ